MILCLDVGNSQIFGGVFEDGKLKLRFRRRSNTEVSSDEHGVFLRSVLQENGVDPALIKKIGFSSVVPEIIHSLKNACSRYFNTQPFVLEPGVKTGLKIKYKNPYELGPDRIANSIAAVNAFPERDLIIIDMGTAITFSAVSAEKEFLGGAIIPGLRTSMEALERNTARLPSVQIVKVSKACARSTIEGIQAGLYFGTLGAIREMVGKISQECFGEKKLIKLGTGGFAGMFADSGVFDEHVPDLVLYGIYHCLMMNPAIVSST
ncbi:MAG: type III pantothenate kinase [Candidatus Riflebacteria bacterium]|nr:type III pantothenate kinase [Candidatus Riflebacteria bacterium]